MAFAMSVTSRMSIVTAEPQNCVLRSTAAKFCSPTNSLVTPL